MICKSYIKFNFYQIDVHKTKGLVVFSKNAIMAPDIPQSEWVPQ